MSRILYQPVFTDNFRFNSYTINFLLPLSEENATSAALLSQVLKRGSEKYGEMDKIVARLEELYGASITVSADKFGEMISFTVQCYCMDDQFAVEGESVFEPALDLMANILLHPITENGVFRTDFFEQEKNNHTDLIRSIINDKRVFSMMRCKEIMFENSNYRFSSNGTLEYLEKITAPSLYSFYQNMLQNASVLVTYIGRKTDVEGLTEKYFSSLKTGDVNSIVKSEIEIPSNVRCVDEKFDVAQGKLCLGFRFTKPVDFFAARLFNVIYGGSPTSKLFMNVREKLSLCYYCSSAIDPMVHSLFISSGIETKNYQTAKDEILRQLDDMKKGEITKEEFENGKLYLLDYVKGIRDSHGALLTDKLRNYFLGFEFSIEEQLERIRQLTMEQIVEVAKCLQLDTVYFLKGEE